MARLLVEYGALFLNRGGTCRRFGRADANAARSGDEFSALMLAARNGDLLLVRDARQH
jgi:hypothetical protein